MVRQRVRIRFAKRGLLRFVGHRDLVRAMERLFRRAGLRLGMSQGFHPKPRMTFPLALAVGVEAEDEVMELELAEELRGEEVLARLRMRALEGLEFRSVEVLGPGVKKAQVQAVDYDVPVPKHLQSAAEQGARHLLTQPSIMVQRPKKGKEFDLRPALRSLDLVDGVLKMRLDCRATAVLPSPREVLAALKLDDLAATGRIVRREVHIANS